MSDHERPEDPSAKGPLKPAARDGVVEVVDPPPAKLIMTPEEADISGIRLLDAADRARRSAGKPRR